MAIADRPIQGGNGGGIAPYLAAGTSRVGRAPWEDELNKLLLGIPQSEWGSIRAGLGLSPGGGYAPGGVQAGTAAPATAAGAAPALMVGSVPAGGAAGGATGEGVGGGGNDPNATGYGQTTDVKGVLGTLGSFALGPIGAALALGVNMVADPNRTSTYGLADMFSGKPTSLTGMLADQWNGNLVNPNVVSPDKTAGPADYGKADFGADFSGTVSSGGPEGGGKATGGADPSQNAENNAPDAGKGDGMADGGQKLRKGGYTGAGRDGVVQPGRPAGTVHESEFVIPHEAVALLGLPFLERLRAVGKT